MKQTIEILKKIRENHEIDFITNSIIKRQALNDCPIPDTEYDLDMIIELTLTIDILQNN